MKDIEKHRLNAFAVVAWVLLTAGQLAHAQTENLLYSFGSQSGDGESPSAGVIMDASGNLYGTTTSGGLACDSTLGCGTVFKLVPPTEAGGSWTEDILYKFGTQAGDGYSPGYGSLARSGSKLYGTTLYGGDLSSCVYSGPSGCGTVFEVSTTTGTETVLLAFGSGNAIGEWPNGAIYEGGDLYGTTVAGGTADPPCGTVFKLVPPAEKGDSWTQIVLHSFGCSPDADAPGPSLLYKDGNLYGTSTQGGKVDNGAVFELSSTAPGPDTILYSFATQASDSVNPAEVPIMDGKGNLYGTATCGGEYGQGGCFNGTVWELSASGDETLLHSFGGPGDGNTPMGGLVRDTKGNLYGTTEWGGAYNDGIVYKLTPPVKKGGAWTEIILYSFGGYAGDGKYPTAGLIKDVDGNLYGATSAGGAHGVGTVFEITP
jgi:uncharacterized repeat protein (TIGR03803 family)